MRLTTLEALADEFHRTLDVYVDYPPEVMDVRRYAEDLRTSLEQATNRNIRAIVDGVGVRFVRQP